MPGPGQVQPGPDDLIDARELQSYFLGDQLQQMPDGSDILRQQALTARQAMDNQALQAAFGQVELPGIDDQQTAQFNSELYREEPAGAAYELVPQELQMDYEAGRAMVEGMMPMDNGQNGMILDQ